MSRVGNTFATVAFGLAAFLIAFTLGTALTAGTGIPLLGGLLNGILVSMVLTIGIVSINKFGTSTIMWLVLSVCAIPTTTLGPQGVYKVVIAIIAGAIWDFIYFGFKRKRFFLYFGALVAALAIMGLLIAALSFGFGNNAAEALAKYKKALLVIIVINIIVTLSGVSLGDYLYRKRLSNLSLFRNLQGNQNNHEGK